MRLTLRSALASAVAVAVVAVPVAIGASADPVVGVDAQCFAKTERIDPQLNSAGVATNPAWIERDQINQMCATERIRDQLNNPAFGIGNLSEGAQLYAAQWEEQLADGPGHLHGGLTTQIPGALGADPFRTIDRWQQLTGGRAIAVKFPSSDGAQLRGHVWLPPKSVPAPPDGYPSVVITDGSIQAYENLYYWAAEGLAQYGYAVMTYDVQGQGHSDLLPKSCSPSDCPGVPYQQNYNFYQGAEDSLSWFLSKANPAHAVINPKQLGIAGHSLGASAVSWVGQCDNRVKTIVAWDDLVPIDFKKCAENVSIPKHYRATALDTPALGTTNDYEFNVQSQTAPPDPHGGNNTGGLAGDSGYQQLAKAGVDSELVSFRNGTHLTYTYIDLVLPSNELSERFAFYYTLAWFDQYLRKGNDPFTPQPALQRLTNVAIYDTSADRNTHGKLAIGAGVYDPTAVDPTDPMSGNVPYEIAGISIPNSLSFYFYSQFRLTDPRSGQVRTCTDMLAGCPATPPSVP
jgi:hypothetical protein